MKLSWKHLAVVLSLTALVSCGSDGDDDDDLGSVQLPQEEEVSNFSTRINNNLLIAGTRCNGGETTTDSSGATLTCERDQWLVTVDNANTCTSDPEPVCTEIAVTPLIARLEREDRVDLEGFTFFEIEPVAGGSAQQRRILSDYLVRFNLDTEEATVIAD